MQRRKSDNFNTSVITSAQRKFEVQWGSTSGRVCSGILLATGCRYHTWFMTGSSVALSWTLRAWRYLSTAAVIGIFIFKKKTLINSSCKKKTHKHVGLPRLLLAHTCTITHTCTQITEHYHAHKQMLFMSSVINSSLTQINTRAAKKMMARSPRELTGGSISALSVCTGSSLTTGRPEDSSFIG